MVHDEAITAKLAVINPDYDPNDEDSESMRWVKPERVMSFDEKKLTLDCTDKSHSQGKRTVGCPTLDDDFECLVEKSGKAATGIGGSTAAFQVLPWGICYGSGKTFDPDWNDGAPQSTIINPATSLPYPMRTWSNAKGSMTGEFCLQYFQKTLATMYPDLSRENPIMVICDGYGGHLTYELLKWCRENGVIIVLRIPHTTHLTQGEDLVNFGELEDEWLQRKAIKMGQKWLEAQKKPRSKAEDYSLSWLDFMVCFKPAAERGFSFSNVVRAWGESGLRPFNRKPYWKLKKKEARKRKAVEDIGVEANLRMMYGCADEPTETANESTLALREHEDEEVQASRSRRSFAGRVAGNVAATSDQAFAMSEEQMRAKKKKVDDAAQRAKDKEQARSTIAQEWCARAALLRANMPAASNLKADDLRALLLTTGMSVQEIKRIKGKPDLQTKWAEKCGNGGGGCCWRCPLRQPLRHQGKCQKMIVIQTQVVVV